MRTTSKLLMIGALLAFGSAACKDFLSGPGVTQDPNAPVAATRGQRLVAVQAAMTVQLTGTLARAACMWMQQCSGVDRQYATLAKYNTTEDDFDTEFTQVWAGGGLLDIRAIEADATAAGDQVFDGIAKVIEALDVGTAADLWGDIPYSEAVGTNLAPHYDTQLSVYTALEQQDEMDAARPHAQGADLSAPRRAARRERLRERAHGGEARDLDARERSGHLPERNDVREQHVVPVSGGAAGQLPPHGECVGGSHEAPRAWRRPAAGELFQHD